MKSRELGLFMTIFASAHALYFVAYHLPVDTSLTAAVMYVNLPFQLPTLKKRSLQGPSYAHTPSDRKDVVILPISDPHITGATLLSAIARISKDITLRHTPKQRLHPNPLSHFLAALQLSFSCASGWDVMLGVGLPLGETVSNCAVAVGEEDEDGWATLTVGDPDALGAVRGTKHVLVRSGSQSHGTPTEDGIETLERYLVL